MDSAKSKTAADIQGTEYDWLGCDSFGHIALFSTAGAGYAPVGFLCDTDAHDVAIQELLALPPTTEARFSPTTASGLVNTWRLVAERGLYAYDCDPNGGPYRLVAAPMIAAKVDDLPHEIVDVATRIKCSTCFANQGTVTQDMLSPST